MRPAAVAVVLGALAVPYLGAGSAAAQPRTAAPDTLFVAGEVAPAVVHIGERVAVRLRMPLPAGGEKLLGPPAPVTMGPVDVVVSEPLAVGADSVGWHLEAAFFQTGEVDLAQVPFRLETATGEVPVRLLPYTISVVSSLPDSLGEADIRPIKGPLDVPARWRWGRIAAALVLAAAAAAGAVLLWRRRRRPVEAVSPYVPDLPPEIVALRALGELEAESLPARGLMKEHYSRLSLILRQYLERRFRVPAVESTTDEIRLVLGPGVPLEPGRRDSLLALFDEADLVKFAKVEPGAAAADDALDRGKAWVGKPPAREETPGPQTAPPPAPGTEGPA
jgi:hypothetical protein